MAKRILIVDDDSAVRELLSQVVGELGFDCEQASDGEEALSWLATDDFEVVFTDLKMPGMDGLEFLKKVNQKYPGLPTVMITAFGTIETAVEAMRLGASDFVLKPFPVGQIKLILERIFRSQEMEQENRRLRELIRKGSPDPAIVGEDLKMREVYQLIEKVAPTETTVLIQGESGTGKELIARVVHKTSGRDAENFVAINCAAFTESLLESEIFGHEAGAFTGATGKKLGLMEVAHGGTLFLDEIGETPPTFQAKLLRAIQEKEILRVGGTKPIQVDTRVIAATNKDLKAEVDTGRFREDLFYRLNVFPVFLPPLRDRRSDIPLLIRHFLKEFGKQGRGKDAPAILPPAEAALARYRWPGNVREVRNVVERAVILAGPAPIGLEHLPPEVHMRRENVSELTRMVDLPFKKAKAELEARYLRELLEEFGGNISKAAEHARIGRGTLHEKLNKLKIDPNDYRGED